MTAGRIARKRPVASSAFVISRDWVVMPFRGTSNPRARKALSTKGPWETFRRRQGPRLVGQLGELDLAAADPRTVHSCYDKRGLLEKNFRLCVFGRNRIRQPPDHQIDFVLTEFAVLQVREIANRDAKGKPRILP